MISRRRFLALLGIAPAVVAGVPVVAHYSENLDEEISLLLSSPEFAQALKEYAEVVHH